MKPGRIAVLCCFAVLATAGEAGSSPRDAGPLPCNAAFHRLAGGTRLSLSLSCATATVAIVRVDFPHADKLRAETAFSGAGCRFTTVSTWYCLFQAGIPAETKIIGTVKFTKAIPRAPQHARLVFYSGLFSAAADTPPAMVGISPNPESGTFAY